MSSKAHLGTRWEVADFCVWRQLAGYGSLQQHLHRDRTAWTRTNSYLKYRSFSFLFFSAPILLKKTSVWTKLKFADLMRFAIDLIAFLFSEGLIRTHGNIRNNTVLYNSAIEQSEKKCPMHFIYSVCNLFITVKNKPRNQGQLIAASVQ